MGTLGVQQMIVIFLVALVLFGPKKLPELGKTIGKALTEFRRASSDLKATFEREMHSLEHENESLKEATAKVNTDIQSNYSYDELPYYDSGAYGSGTQGSTTPETTTPSPATPDSPSVSASAVPGAESQGQPEGTVARTETHPVTPAPPVS